jgi:hypothetical protein
MRLILIELINMRVASGNASSHITWFGACDVTVSPTSDLVMTSSALSAPARSAYRQLWRASSWTFAGDAPVLTGMYHSFNMRTSFE